MPDLDWPHFILENLPLILVWALILVTPTFISWRTAYEFGRAEGRRLGKLEGYRNGQVDEREKLMRDEPLDYPTITETLPDGRKVRHW